MSQHVQLIFPIEVGMPLPQERPQGHTHIAIVTLEKVLAVIQEKVPTRLVGLLLGIATIRASERIGRARLPVEPI